MIRYVVRMKMSLHRVKRDRVRVPYPSMQRFPVSVVGESWLAGESRASTTVFLRVI
jgi:hypothetical protein